MIVRGKRDNKIGIGFISIFLLKALVSYLTILKRKNLSLALKDETDQFVTCLVLQSVFRSKLHFALEQFKANRDGADTESPFPLFFSFSASFKNFSPREKLGNCLRWDWWMESLFLSIIVAKYLNILPRANNGRLREKKKILAKLFARAIRVHYRDSKHAYIY